MPCRDYESDNYSDDTRNLKIQADRLARIACKVMDALVEAGKEDFVLLQDDEVREWWAAHQIADAKEKAKLAEKERLAKVKRDALAKLSDEEKKVLGISIVRKRKKSIEDEDWD